MWIGRPRRRSSQENPLVLSAPAGSMRNAVTPIQEVRPMNAVTMWVLPFSVTVGD